MARLVARAILALFAAVCLAYLPTVIADIHPYKGGPIRAASYEIHYSEGYLVTPGYVDVSGLTFVAQDSPSDGGGGAFGGRDDDDMIANDDDGTGNNDNTVETPPPTPAPMTVAPTASPVSSAPTATPTAAKVETTAPTAAPISPAPTVAKVETEPPVTAAPTAAKVETEPPVTAAPTPAEVEKVETPAPTAAKVETEPPVTAAPTVPPVTAAPTTAPVVAEPAPEPAPADNNDADGGDDNTDGDGRRLQSGTTVDIVVFRVPDECAKSKDGCDWTELGVGASNGMALKWCCSDDAISLGFCNRETEYGRFIIDKTKFQGDHRVLAIPSSGHIERSITDGKMKFDTGDGRYIMIIANCNDFGRDLELTGSYAFVSKHGYLPGELFGEMYFFAAITLVYLVLFLWYGCSMQCHAESRIPVQQWIIVSIGLGLLECFFKSGDFFVWNEDGVRVWYAMYVGVVLGVIKRGISRSLIIMVALGWGVIRDELTQMGKIYFLGFLYVGTTCAVEIMTIVAVEDMAVISEKEEDELVDIITILTFVVAAIDVTYLIWALDALNSSMQYLENMNQNVKLKQYLRLRCFILLSMLFAVAWATFSIVNTYMDAPMLEDKQEWSIGAAWQLNYLFLLIGIACLWRPTANAKEYAFVMELPSMAADGNEMIFDTNVDTIDDDDDLNDVSDHAGNGSNPLEDDEGFAIDKAIDA